MEEAIISSLGEAGVGVVAIAAIVFISRAFLARLKEKDEEFIREINKREQSFQTYANSRHQEMIDLHKNTMIQLAENTKAMERVITHLDKS